MTNFASNFTPRLRAQYQVDDTTHTVLLRSPSGSPFEEADAQALLEAWRAAMADLFALDSLQPVTSKAKADILSAEFAQEDDDIFIPFAPSGDSIAAGDNTAGNVSPLSRATLLSITGKGVAGKKITLYVWGLRFYDLGISSGVDSDWRLSAGETTGLTAVWSAHFQPSVGGSLAALMAGPDGQPVAFFRQRLNLRISASAINSARG